MLHLPYKNSPKYETAYFAEVKNCMNFLYEQTYLMCHVIFFSVIKDAVLDFQNVPSHVGKCLTIFSGFVANVCQATKLAMETFALHGIRILNVPSVSKLARRFEMLM